MIAGMAVSTAQIHVAAGPRESEQKLLEWLERHRAKKPAELRRSLRVIVPSRSLRRHLLAAIPRKLGALAGARVQTHRSLAREILEYAGQTPPQGGAEAMEVLVRRFACEDPNFSGNLDPLNDGYAPVVAAVRDLVDAGLDPGAVEAAAEAVSEAAHGLEEKLALALIRVAGAWIDASSGGKLPSRSGLLLQATALLAAGEIPPTRGLLIYGFAEATGLVSDFLELLCRRHGAELLLDLPPDPACPEERSAGSVFVERIADRLGGPGCLELVEWVPPADPAPVLDAFSAPGPEAEIREIAARIRCLLDAGASPEGIGVVARLIDASMAASIRRHFRRLGIPFSGEGVTLPRGGKYRRFRALLELLSRRGRTAVSSWLECVEVIPGVEDLLLLEVALRSAGAACLNDLESMDLDHLCPKGSLKLPLVEGIREDGGDGRRIHPSLARKELEAAQEAARSLLAILEERPGEAFANDYFRWIRKILDLTGISEDRDLSQSLDDLSTKLRALPSIRWEHLESLLPRLLDDPSKEVLGGSGGGVQVLSVMEARSRCFEHLFLRGLNRGNFPRKTHEDPIFPESIRHELSVILSEIPLAERSRLEENYLFAQLLSASQSVTLSWRKVEADGKAANPSAFIERLRLEGRLPEEKAPVRDVFSPSRESGGAAGIRPALEHAAISGLEGRREELVLAAEALKDGRSPHLKPLLDELAPPQPREDLGPFLGLTGIGPPQELWVTRLESYSACPWKQFLEKELGLEAPAEALSAGTPFRGLLVGRVVHEVLEKIVARAGAPVGRDISLDMLRNSPPLRVPWPADDQLSEWLRRASQKVAGEEGLPVLGSPLARAARAYLEQAREEDWSRGFREVLGAEISGRCPLNLESSGMVDIHFRADRVDAREKGLLLTDYKTGTSGQTLPTELRKGRRLQAAVYACSGGEDSRGRYLFLDPDSERRIRDIGPEESAEELARVINILLSAWREGLAIPRWEGDENNSSCRYCDLQEACFRSDSGFRSRLRRVIDNSAEDDPLPPLWQLPKPSSGRGGS